MHTCNPSNPVGAQAKESVGLTSQPVWLKSTAWGSVRNSVSREHLQMSVRGHLISGLHLCAHTRCIYLPIHLHATHRICDRLLKFKDFFEEITCYLTSCPWWQEEVYIWQLLLLSFIHVANFLGVLVIFLCFVGLTLWTYYVYPRVWTGDGSTGRIAIISCAFSLVACRAGRMGLWLYIMKDFLSFLLISGKFFLGGGFFSSLPFQVLFSMSMNSSWVQSPAQ